MEKFYLTFLQILIIMKILLQDVALKCSYLLDEHEIEKRSIPFENTEIEADLIFVVPGDSLVEEMQEMPYHDGPILTIAILDPSNKKVVHISREELENFEVENFQVSADTVSFSIPSSLELVQQVDLFRRALVQNSS